MKRKLAPILMLSTALLINACQQADPINDTSAGQIPTAILQKLEALGFDITHTPPTRSDNGYYVEGDIHITDTELNSMHQNTTSSNPEQYWTGNRVTGTPRTVTIFIAPTLPAAYVTALNSAIAQYNTLGLTLTFTRVSTSASASIIISRLPAASEAMGIYASSGFPSASGNPYSSILMSGILVSTYGLTVPGISTLIVHELGHCIGVRHTNVGDPQCPLTGVGFGILVPGTPTIDPNSVMRPCHDGIFRPLSQYDIITLNYIY